MTSKVLEIDSRLSIFLGVACIISNFSKPSTEPYLKENELFASSRAWLIALWLRELVKGLLELFKLG
jgi:hypothetical protein